MILTVGNTKGGVGKTTLATNIAVARALAGSDVYLIDTDDQRSASDFVAARSEALGEPGFTAAYLEAKGLTGQIRQIAKKYSDIVIDAGGRDSAALRAAMLASDVVLVPVQPRSYDIWALDNMLKTIEEVRSVNTDLKAVAVLNAADAQGRENEEAASAIRELTGIELLEPTIGRRKVFGNSTPSGRSVLEYLPRDLKAIDELQALVAAIY